MRGKLRDLTLNRDGSQNITVTITDTDYREAFDTLAGKELDIEIKLHRRRRSLEANAYCWVLVDKIAAAMHLDKVEVYRQAIRSIGGVSQIICVPENKAEQIRAWWSCRGIGWITETLPSKLPGCTNLMVYAGSSEYDTAQMSALIDHLIQDAEAIGIETITPKERQRLLAEWERRHG